MTRIHRQMLCYAGFVLLIMMLKLLFTGLVTPHISILHDVVSIAPAAAVMVWGSRIRVRIIHPRTRHLLYAVSWLLAALFVMRLCRSDFFEYSTAAMRILQYLYYIPYIFVPLFSFLAAVRLDEYIATPRPAILRALIGMSILLTVVVMTNDLHGWLMRFDEASNSHHRWFYGVILLWSLLLSAGVLIVLIRCCRLSQCRHQLYVPLFMTGVGLFMLAVFVIVGGSPTMFGQKLYYSQGAYALTVVGMWEGCILIGLLPTNTGYKQLFPMLHISAEIENAEGTEKYSSVQVQTGKDPDDLVHFSKPLHGGTVRWTEDMHAVRDLRGRIAEVNASLAEENDLIEEENRITSERLQYETQNRLYDRIAAHSHRQLAMIADSLADTETFTAHIRENILLGTYVKRNANLMLLASKQRMLSASELMLALRETMENLRLFSVDCALEGGEVCDVPAQMIVDAYDIAEAAAEYVYRQGSVLTAAVLPDADTLLLLETDAEVPEETLRQALEGSALTIAVSETDDTCCIRLGGVPHD